MNYILHFFFKIQYNIGFRNKRSSYINPFPKKKPHEKLEIVIKTYSIHLTFFK